VYEHTGTGNSTTPVNSQAFVDASAFPPTTGDLCAIINYILTNSQEFDKGGNSNGVIINARGMTTSPQPCGSNPFAGFGIKGGDSLSSTILLPAATIQITQAWVLPDNARISGEGQGLTVLQAKSGFAGDMIDMGNSTVCAGNPLDCQGNGIEHITLDAQSLAGVNGIHNTGSEELSYVKDVALINVVSTGLWIDGGGAGNSGPYSNIYFSGNGTCVKINGTGTRGIHGLTCITSASTGALVYLDGPNNSIEDVNLTYIATNGPGGGGGDGILVGSQVGTGFTGAQSNVLMNITGNNLASVIHISNTTSTQSYCTPQNFGSFVAVNNVCDLTVLGVSNSGSTATIKDDLTSTTLIDATVGMYVVGVQVSGGANPVGNSRFTTSPSLPTWLVGSGTPSSSCGTGSLYSNTVGTAGATLWACVSGTWKEVQ